MKISDFDFSLPETLIAQSPCTERTGSKLLCLNGNTGHVEDRVFHQLDEMLQPGDLLVLNNTRVIPARVEGNKDTGGQVEILVERVIDAHNVRALIRSSRSPKAGQEIIISDHRFQVESRDGTLFLLKYMEEGSVYDLLDKVGHMPLPPYITRKDTTNDRERYQTVFGHILGSAAAPTAGLHFDKAMLEKLKELGVETTEVTLHVGLGTFEPVRVDDLTDHVMHSERIDVPQQTVDKIQQTRKRGGRIIAVGTTSVRALESAAVKGDLEAYFGETRLFITPGYNFRVVDAMITNFHLPQSTLLMLVCAFAGQDQVLDAYQHAVESAYRFFSYGDAMFITQKTE